MLMIFTVFHVLISLVGIATGFLVLYGFITSSRQSAMVNWFLATTFATSATGFLFPFHGFTPGIGVGIISLIVLFIAFFALRRSAVSPAWERVFVVTAVIALYLNVFVLVVQLFQKVNALKALAPTQSEPPFAIAQLAVLVSFVALGTLAVKRVHQRVFSTV